MTKRLIFAAFFSSFLLSTLARADSKPQCPAEFAEVEKKPADAEGGAATAIQREASEIAGKSVYHMDTFEKNLIVKTVRNFRDKFRQFITSVSGSDYPILALDDGTPLKAHILANETTGIPQAVLDAIKIDDLKLEIINMVQKAKALPADLQQIQLNAANAFAEHEALVAAKAAMKKAGAFPNELQVEIQLFHFEGEELVPDTAKTLRVFPSPTHLDKSIKSAKKLYQYSTSMPIGPWGKNTADDRMIEQAILLKKLETYVKEMRFERDNHGIALSADAQELHDLILQLYAVDANGATEFAKGKFAKGIGASRRAWQRVKLMQLGGELYNLIWKKIPLIGESLKENAYFQVLQSITEDERAAIFRRLGLSRVAQGTGYITRSGPVVRIVTLFLGGSEVAGAAADAVNGGEAKHEFIVHGLTDLYHAVFDHLFARDKCIKASDDEYVACLTGLIQQKFPLKSAYYQSKPESLLDPDSGKIRDPEILIFVQNLQRDRLKYAQEQRWDRNNLSMQTKLAQGINLNSDEYQQKLARNQDKQAFVASLIGRSATDPDAYFHQMYPLTFTANARVMIRDALMMNNPNLDSASLAEDNKPDTGYNPTFKDKIEAIEQIDLEMGLMTSRMAVLHAQLTNTDPDNILSLPDNPATEDVQSLRSETSANNTTTNSGTNKGNTNNNGQGPARTDSILRH